MEKFIIIGKQYINSLPKTAGVYLFYEKTLDPKRYALAPIYIGKAINIKSRVKNHFYPVKYREAVISPEAKLFNRVNQPSYRNNLFIQKVRQIRYIETGSEIEALILEAKLIKQHQPKFNVVWRDDKNYFYVAIAKNSQKIPYVYITHQPKKVSGIKYKVSIIQNTKYKIPNTRYIGPFVEGNALKKMLKYLRRVFPFYTKSAHSRNACTWCHLDLCPGPNPNLADYKNNVKKLALILRGKQKTVLFSLRKEINVLARDNKFERAASVRDKMLAIERILEHAHVIENNKAADDWQKTQVMLQEILEMKNAISKIECYDISNIQGKNAVGSMVVFVNEKPDKSQYKKFKIKMKQEPNDIAMIKEILTRRLKHPEWPYPDVILIDGGIAQLNIGIKTKNQISLNLELSQFREKIKNIKIISIAKGRQELFIENQKKPIPLKNLPQEIYNLIKHLDDEAHRFAINYHKKLRRKSLLGL